MKRQAKAGGEYGANGEWYKGGTFINTVPENPKGKAKTKKKAPRKVEIFPYQWEFPPTEDHLPIYRNAGVGLHLVEYDYHAKTGIMEVYEPYLRGLHTMSAYYGGGCTLEEVEVIRAWLKELADKFNNGERWYMREPEQHTNNTE